MGIESTFEKLLGKTRSRLIAMLFANPEKDFYVREIVGAVGAGSGSVQRELEFLRQSELISRSERGNQVLYQANPANPLYADLVQMVRKTSGVETLVRKALAKLGPRISIALIFGSYAAKQERAKSDIDVLVIGSASFGEVVEALSGIQQTVGREINPVVYDETEFLRRVRTGNHFVKTILGKPMILVLGDKRELERMGGARLDRGALDQRRRDR